MQLLYFLLIAWTGYEILSLYDIILCYTIVASKNYLIEWRMANFRTSRHSSHVE